MKISSESPCPTLSEDPWTLWLLEIVGHHLRAEGALQNTELPSLPHLLIFEDYIFHLFHNAGDGNKFTIGKVCPLKS